MYLLPKPRKWKTTEGIFTICYNRAIVVDNSCPPEVYEDAKLFQQVLCESLGFALRITVSQWYRQLSSLLQRR